MSLQSRSISRCQNDARWRPHEGSRLVQQMIASVKTGKKTDRHWSPEEDRQLLDLVDAEATWPLIAITLGQSVQAVQERAQKLGRPVVEFGPKAKGK
jgi:hypothetical protein